MTRQLRTILIEEPDFFKVLCRTDPQLLLNNFVVVLEEAVKLTALSAIDPTLFAVSLQATSSYFTVREKAADLYNQLNTLTEPQLGWALIHLSTVQAVTQWLHRLQNQFPGDVSPAIRDKASDIAKNIVPDEMRRETISLDETFLINPLPDFCQRLTNRFQDELQAWKITPECAGEMANHFRPYYLAAISAHLYVQKTKYQRLTDSLIVPIEHSLRSETQWQEYREYLLADLARPLFNEHFPLEAVHIPLRCVSTYKHHTPPQQSLIFPDQDNPRTTNASNKSTPKKRDLLNKFEHRIEYLETHILGWIEDHKHNYKPADAIRLIEGGPGAGKSCAMKRLAAKLQVDDPSLRVLLIPLHNYEFDSDLSDSIDNFCQNPSLKSELPRPELPIGLINRKNEREKLLILIFDGLDELSKQGSIGLDLASSLVAQVHKHIDNNCTVDGKKIITIFSGRPIAVTHASRHIINASQQIEILPYSFQLRSDWTDPQNLASIDQRDTWWKLYGSIKNQPFEKMPSELSLLCQQQRAIKEITEQPLTNYLLALTYLRNQSSSNTELTSATQPAINFSLQITVNDIYADLLSNIWNRKWGDGGPLPITKQTTFEDFEWILEQVAIVAWHKEAGRGGFISDVEEKLTARMRVRLEDMGRQKGLLLLFLNFYLRTSNVDGKEHFEFTHKSFGEFLTARHMWSAIVNICKDYQRGKKDRIRRTGYSLKETFIDFTKLFGPTRLTFDIIKFISEELRAQYSAEVFSIRRLEQIRSWIIELLNSCIECGSPMLEASPHWNSYQNMNRQAINSEEALFVLHHLVSERLSELYPPEKTVKPAVLRYPSEETFSDWLCRIRGQSTNRPMHFFLGWLNLRRQRLLKISFFQSYMPYTDFREANLYESDFIGADLNGANFQNAYLRNADFSGSEVINANFRNSNLIYSRFYDTDLEGVIFEGCSMHGVFMRKAKLKNTNFTHSDLTKANLTRTSDLTELQLEESAGFRLAKLPPHLSAIHVSKYGLPPTQDSKSVR